MNYKHLLLLIFFSLFWTVLKSQQLNIDIDKSQKFNLTIGGNIAHSGEKMGIWPDSIFQAVKDVGIKLLRTHDTKSLDWDIIFPKWGSDPEDSSNYNFKDADRIITYMENHDFQPFLRLGVSTSALTNNRVIGLNPPDVAEWTLIVNKIIQHYKSGWDNGFKYPIEYIEIWNEPDIAYWKGSAIKFAYLSASIIKVLKAEYPDTKIGLCGVSNIKKNINFVKVLLAYLSNPNGDGNAIDRIPLDFFSWHVYEMKKGVTLFKELDNQCRSLLDEYGYKKTESICSEFNVDLPRSEYFASNSATIDFLGSIMWAETNNVSALLIYPLIDTWGIFHVNGSVILNNVTNITGTNLSIILGFYNRFRQTTPIMLNSSREDISDSLQLIAAKYANSNNIKILAVSGQNINQSIKIVIQNLHPGSYKISTSEFKEELFENVSTPEIFISSNGSLIFNKIIKSNSIQIFEIENIK